MTKNKKIINTFLLSTPIIAVSSFGLVSCVNPFSKNPIKLDSSQIQQIKNSFVFELTNAGKTHFKNNYEEIPKFLNKKATEHNKNAIELKNDAEVKKYFNLDFINVNNLAWGHTLELKFKIDNTTKIPYIYWEVSCSAYGVEGKGNVLLEI